MSVHGSTLNGFLGTEDGMLMDDQRLEMSLLCSDPSKSSVGPGDLVGNLLGGRLQRLHHAEDVGRFPHRHWLIASKTGKRH